VPAPRECSLTEFVDLLRESLASDACWGVVLSQPRFVDAQSRGRGSLFPVGDARVGLSDPVDRRPEIKTPDPFAERPSKLTARPIELSGERRYQLAERRGKQEFHQNLTADELLTRITADFGEGFEQADLFTPDADHSARVIRNGIVRVTRRKPSKSAPPLTHDRRKQYLIPEGRPCPFLTEIGVMTPAGQVKAAKQAKFRQVNRFLEFVDDVLPELPATGVLRIIDFGCGKSSLTFALHYLLTKLRGREVEIIGLDLKSEVVRDCQRIAETLGCRGLRFEVGDIAGYAAAGPVDMSVSLHACDTATDAAIAQAVRWQTKVILAVPCCQHEVFSLLTEDSLPGMLRHGILKERFAALATDALRAALLEAVGYRTQVVEFIDLEHTPKNLLLRAVRADQAISNASECYQRLKEQLGLRDFALERFEAIADRMARERTP
jgi:SAM-dependent methyltransferase